VTANRDFKVMIKRHVTRKRYKIQLVVIDLWTSATFDDFDFE